MCYFFFTTFNLQTMQSLLVSYQVLLNCFTLDIAYLLVPLLLLFFPDTLDEWWMVMKTLTFLFFALFKEWQRLHINMHLVFQGPVSKPGKKTGDRTRLNWIKTGPWSRSLQGPRQSGLGLFDILKLRKPPKNRSRPVETKTGLSTGFNIKRMYNRRILLNFSFILSL